MTQLLSALPISQESRNGQLTSFISNYSGPVQTFQTLLAAVASENLPAFRDVFYPEAKEPVGEGLSPSRIVRDEASAREVLSQLRGMMKNGLIGRMTLIVYQGDGQALYLYETGKGKTGMPVHFTQNTENGNRWQIDSFSPHPFH